MKQLGVWYCLPLDNDYYLLCLPRGVNEKFSLLLERAVCVDWLFECLYVNGGENGKTTICAFFVGIVLLVGVMYAVAYALCVVEAL